MDNRSTAYWDLVRKKHSAHEQLKFLQKFREQGGMLTVVEHTDLSLSAKEIIRLLAPQNAEGQEKIRLGGNSDGGYVMLDPGHDGIAYSLGVSPSSPWDLQMAERGFQVFQYDASVDREPDEHPNIFFHKYFVSGARSNALYKTMDQILHENGHETEADIILQMDIEGAEWEVLASLSREHMLKFKQIIIEFHSLDFFIHKYRILQKMRETHTPVHLHYNNCSPFCQYFPKSGFLYCGHLIEMTYARNGDFPFSECTDYFPTSLDHPNSVLRWPDMPIGYFDLLLREDW